MVQPRLRSLASAALAALVLAACNATTGTPLPGAHWYPRVVLLQHGAHAGEVLGMTDGNGGAFWRSTDQGLTFSEVGPYPNPSGAWSSIFEMPRTVGDVAAGTVLWATAVSGGPGRTLMRVEIWASTDGAATWSHLSDCVDPSDTPDYVSGGIFEPDLHLTDDDRLVCVYSTEAHQPAYSQTLDEAVSTDGGQTWAAPTHVVALPQPFNRPGMGTVVRLPDGRWMMGYEICGFPYVSCPAHIRYSSDGVEWGDPTQPGHPVTAPDGTLPSHAPVLGWLPWGGPLGTLVLTAQEFSIGGLVRGPSSGNSLLLNRDGGAGAWEYAPMPVMIDFTRTPITSGYDWCSNYTTPVIPLATTGQVLQLDSGGLDGECRTFHASGSL